MLKKISTSTLIGVLLLGIIVLLGVSFYNQQQKLTQQSDQYQTKIENLKEKNSSANERVRQLSDQYDKLYAEKKGTKNERLLNSVHHLFSTLYNYDTSNPKQSVFHRKEDASKVVNKAALETLFPKDAETITPSVTTVSTLDSDPECYIMSSDDREVKALIVVKNTIRIADGDTLTDSYIYKIRYDASRDQIIEIVGLGNIKL